ncbi:hypothetical protein PVAND_007681 [Polypedilum vanderplanki]|uniref:CHK kinase-like domain-containing protein n=1 Tax=Polypedilum vanderplanki TaxID=319348 RepID=A0A9J6C7B8_POLVA|nr:hypothetical protein PVAND_007681 [Polypedilum vanderplanki]
MSQEICDNDKIVKLPNELYEKTLREIIYDELKLNNNEYEIKYSEGSSKGDNYNGIVYRVQVIKDNEIKLSLIVKLPPDNPSRREEFLVHKSFIQEADFYDYLYPLYRKFQEKHGICVETDGLYEIPKCYKTLTEEPLEALYFDDLKVHGFQMFDRTKELTREHVLIVMKALAKMHATYFSIKDQNPELVDKYRSIKDFILMQCHREEAAMKIFNEKMKQQALDVLKHSKDEEFVKKIQKVLSVELHKILEEGISIEEPYAILCHGDCWVNNIMYKNDVNGVPIECRLLDHTIMRYASPITDLMYLIFSGTTKVLRDKHYQEFLDVYFENLSEFIKRLNSDPEKLFPRSIFEHHLKKFGKFGLVMAIILVPMFTSSAEDIPEMDDVADEYQLSKEASGSVMNFTSSKTIGVYEKRMLGILQDMVEFGYI